MAKVPVDNLVGKVFRRELQHQFLDFVRAHTTVSNQALEIFCRRPMGIQAHGNVFCAQLRC